MVRVRTFMTLVGLAFSFAVAAPVPVGSFVIDGRVVEDVGMLTVVPDPIPDVKVYLEKGDELVYLMDGGELRLAPIEIPIGPIMPPYPYYILVDSATTDQNGDFALGEQTGGMYRVTFTKDGYGTQQVYLYLAADTTLNVALKGIGTTATVSGAVYAACSDPLGMPCVMMPIEGCAVSVIVGGLEPVPYELGGPYEVPVGSFENYTAVTDADGNYSITGVPAYTDPQIITVVAAKSGFVTELADTSASDGGPVVVNFVLEPALTAARPEPRGRQPRGGAAQVSGDMMAAAPGVSVEMFRPDGRMVGWKGLVAGRAAGVGLARIRGEGYNKTMRIISGGR